MFTLHPQLAKDCYLITDLPLCRLLLLNDANYPWFVLVPRRNDISEIHQLEAVDQAQLLLESNILSKFMVAQFSPDKLNIAALGNIVPQLHIHHIGRYKTDLAWPAPVWGKLPAKHYAEDAVDALISITRGALGVD